MPGSNFVKKCCKSSKKQINTISNTEWRVILVDHESECLKILREFSLLFENTIKLSCCFIIFLDDIPPSMLPLYLGLNICHYIYKVKIDGKTNSST